MIKTANTFVSVKGAKTAALYADWVIPIALMFDVPPNESVNLERLVRNLMPEDIHRKLASNLLESINVTWAAYRLLGGTANWGDDKFRNIDHTWTLGRLILRMMFLEPDRFGWFGASGCGNTHSAREHFVTSMAGLDMIDADRLSWETILAVREDPQARLKLRRLRTLFEENYSDKSTQFVEDDLLIRIDDYESVIKEFGLATTSQVFEQFADSKSTVAMTIGSLTAALLGVPTVAIAAAVGGAAIEIGKVSIGVATRRHALSKELNELRVGYLVDLSKLTKRSS